MKPNCTFCALCRLLSNLAVVLACSLAYPLYADCISPPANLVSWWRAEGDANDTIGNNNGILMNGTGMVPGKVGQAFSLDGVQSVEIPDSPALHLASITIEGWVQFANAGGIQVFFSKPFGPGVLDSFSVWLENGNLKAVTSDASAFAPFLSIPFSPTIGRWYYIAFSFDNATKQESLYLDGTRVASATAGRPIAYDSHPLLLGRVLAPPRDARGLRHALDARA